MDEEEFEIIEDETYDQLRERNAYLTTNRSCPKCKFHPLEYQVVGYQREVFCPRCDFMETQNM